MGYPLWKVSIQQLVRQADPDIGSNFNHCFGGTAGGFFTADCDSDSVDFNDSVTGIWKPEIRDSIKCRKGSFKRTCKKKIMGGINGT